MENATGAPHHLVHTVRLQQGSDLADPYPPRRLSTTTSGLSRTAQSRIAVSGRTARPLRPRPGARPSPSRRRPASVFTGPGSATRSGSTTTAGMAGRRRQEHATTEWSRPSNVTQGCELPGQDHGDLLSRTGHRSSLDAERDSQPSQRLNRPATTPYYMEAEINSPIVTLRPGESHALDTVWHPMAIMAKPQEMHSSGVVVDRLNATHEGKGVHLHGGFSVFVPGTLVALFFNEHGLEVARQEIERVDPIKPVVLDATVPMTQDAARVNLMMIGAAGEDEGILAKGMIEPAKIP